MITRVDRYFQELHRLLNELGEDLGHPEDPEQVFIVLVAFLHTIRNRIPIQGGFHFMAQLPMILKGLFADKWSYSDDPLVIRHWDEFCEHFEKEQHKHGERSFDWNMDTAQIIRMTFQCLTRNYFSSGEITHVLHMLPNEIVEEMEKTPA